MRGQSTRPFMMRISLMPRKRGSSRPARSISVTLICRFCPDGRLCPSFSKWAVKSFSTLSRLVWSKGRSVNSSGLSYFTCVSAQAALLASKTMPANRVHVNFLFMMIPFKEFDGLQATSDLSATLYYKRISCHFLRNSYLVTIFLPRLHHPVPRLFLQFRWQY